MKNNYAYSTCTVTSASRCSGNINQSLRKNGEDAIRRNRFDAMREIHLKSQNEIRYRFLSTFLGKFWVISGFKSFHGNNQGLMILAVVVSTLYRT